MLSDGRWHEIEEIRQKMQLEENQTQELLTFLKEYNFIVFEETKKAIKIEGRFPLAYIVAEKVI